MIFNTFIHGANPIKFIPTGYTPTDRYNTVPLDKQWFSEGILSWQQNVTYYQLVQLKDRLSLQFWATPDTDISLSLYKCDGTLVDSDVFTLIPTPNNINFNGSVYNAYQFVQNDYWSDRDEGLYYLYAEFVSSDESETTFYISEPISLKAKHEGSVLLGYSRPDNVGGLICEQTRQKFEKRVFGAMLQMEPKVERVSFFDSGYNTTQLRAESYRGWTFVLGGNGGQCTDSEIDIVSKIWDFPTVKVDNKSFVAADGAVLEKEIHENYPLYAATIEVRESVIDDAFKITKGELQMMVFTAYPFVIMWSEVGSDGVFDFYYDSPRYIANLTDFQNYAITLNSLALIQGIEGTFRADGTGLYYALGDGESYTQAESKQLVNRMTITHTTTGTNQDINFTTSMEGSVNGSEFCTVSPDFSVESYGTTTTGNNITYTSHYIAPTAGTYTSYIFHDNTMFAMTLTGSFLTNTGGLTPFQLNQFNLINNPRLTSYNLYTSLFNSKLNLKILLVQNNITLSNVNQYYYSPSVGLNFSLGAVQLMSFSGNNMNTTQLNALYNNVAGMTNSAVAAGLMTVHNGFITTNNQVTTQQPNGASLVARSTLASGYGWTVTI